MNDELKTSILVLFSIAPILVVGLWLIASESFVGLTASRTTLLNSPSRRRIFNRSITIDSFVLFGIAVILGSLTLVFLWQAGKALLGFSFALAATLILIRERRTKRELVRQLDEIDSELPRLVQMICLLLSAGITPLKSIDLISRSSNSLLALELRKVIEDIERGSSVPEAFDKFLARVGTTGTRRFVTNLLVAMERGAPLIPVMISLIRDFHSDAKTRLLRQAGKSEIALMVPVVFLLLPISVLFALFPSISQMQFFI